MEPLQRLNPVKWLSNNYVIVRLNDKEYTRQYKTAYNGIHYIKLNKSLYEVVK